MSKVWRYHATGIDLSPKVWDNQRVHSIQGTAWWAILNKTSNTPWRTRGSGPANGTATAAIHVTIQTGSKTLWWMPSRQTGLESVQSWYAQIAVEASVAIQMYQQNTPWDTLTCQIETKLSPKHKTTHAKVLLKEYFIHKSKFLYNQVMLLKLARTKAMLTNSTNS